jgi:hypothetical protein
MIVAFLAECTSMESTGVWPKDFELKMVIEMIRKMKNLFTHKPGK